MKRLYWLCLFLLVPILVSAKDLPGLYDEGTLAYWQTRYPRNIQWNFDNVILPFLTPSERGAFAGVNLHSPLTGEFRSDPLEYYSTLNPPRVTMPILSIKFFDDLSVAYAWLWVNDYSVETVTDYVAMLKYSKAEKFPGGRYPAPLEALQIPHDALEDPEVDGLSQKILKSAVIWILAHELGHIYYRHPGYGPGVNRKQAQANEEEADGFAMEVMRRIGVPPVGMTFFFMVAAHWWENRGDFPSDKAWEEYLEKGATHPLTAHRLHALAQRLKSAAPDFARNQPDYSAGVERVRDIANQLSGVANILQDPDIQRSIVSRGLATDLSSLTPRRLGELPVPRAQAHKPEQVAKAAFHGIYTAEYVHYVAGLGSEKLAAQMVLERTGERVSGRFGFGLGEGIVSGIVLGDILYFDWHWGDAFGRGTLQSTDHGRTFSGTWGYGESRDNGGTWYGCRQ